MLVLLFHVGGGYVFSNMIKTDALTPEPPTPDNGIYVLDLDADSITVMSTDKRADSKHPGTFGLAWESGYGRIGNIISVDGLDVTRRFELVSGTTPQICGVELDGCAEVDIEGWTFENDPTDVGLGFEEIQFQSPLGAMSGWRVGSPDRKVWAVHVHGWRASKREAIRSLSAFDDAGITSLVIDYRNDPNAPADPSGLYRFGQTEWQDVDGAVSYAIDHGATEIVLVGYSTGAAIHAAYLENSDTTEFVKAVVLDSPNLDMGETVRSAASDMTLPGTALPVPPTLTWSAMAIADWRFGVDWAAIDYTSRADEIFTIPTIIFHGSADQRVPADVSRLVAETSESVQLVETPFAGHVNSWNVDPAAYEEALREFLVSSTDA